MQVNDRFLASFVLSLLAIHNITKSGRSAKEKCLMEVCLFQQFSFLLWNPSLWIFWILPSFSKHILFGKADFIEVMTNLQSLCGYYVCIYITTYWAARYFMACKDSWEFHICNLVTVETKCMPKNWDFFTNYILNCTLQIYSRYFLQFLLCPDFHCNFAVRFTFHCCSKYSLIIVK